MSVVRAALMLSLGIIISVGIVVLFLHHKDRFTIVPQNRGIFVFDYKNSSVSFCTSKGCTLISVNADSYHHSAREMYFMPQGYMSSPPQYPMGFMSPQAMQPNPYNSPYSPYMPQVYPQPQNFGPQSGWVGFQNFQAPMAPAAPGQPMQLQQQQASQEQQPNFMQEPQSQEQQMEQQLDQIQQETQQQQDQAQPQDQGQEQGQAQDQDQEQAQQ